MDATLKEVEFLVSSTHRVGVLDALAERACDRNDLRAATGASTSTVSRILSDFEERHWVARDGPTYRLTDLGVFVAGRLGEFTDAMALERTVRDVWRWLPHGMEGFDVELFSDVVVSRPGPGYPYRPIERIGELIETGDSIRGFGMMLLKSSNLKSFVNHLDDGVKCEYIYPPEIFEELLAWDAERVVTAADRENFTVLLHDDLPMDERCGICLFGDRVGFCCIDPETAMVYALVDTGSPEMCAWADEKLVTFRAEATPLDDARDLLSSDLLP
jgi:predicted transcriptional regulator